ncbi:hypothetical protein DSM25558_4493 [Agrobacterium sp. DSM 25558]|nr:hypothetical protein DSM25558_4493 [Agrobacterium sp. DSM 25558]
MALWTEQDMELKVTYLKYLTFREREGTILRSVVGSGIVSRICVSGGDTSGAAISALSIAALLVARSIRQAHPCVPASHRRGESSRSH